MRTFRITRGIRNLILLINILMALLYAGCCIASRVNPEEMTFFAFLSLGFVALLLVNIVFVLFWLVFKPIYSLVSLAVVLMFYSSIGQVLAFNTGDSDPEGPTLKVMSYNVKNFDLYNWSGNEASRDEMMGLISDANPDVICFQEFYTEDEGNFNNLNRLSDAYPYHHFKKTLSLRSTDHWGIATFSKFPIIERVDLPFPDTRHNLCLATDIESPLGTIRVYNTHLQSNHLSQDDYEYITEGSDNTEDNWRSMTGIIRKLSGAYRKRAVQVSMVKDWMSESPYPYILCGDFNDPPNSYSYRELSQGMQDAFLQEGFGIGQTYSGPLPALRIDFILANDEWTFYDYKVRREDWSDHYPIMAELGL